MTPELQALNRDREEYCSKTFKGVNLLPQAQLLQTDFAVELDLINPAAISHVQVQAEPLPSVADLSYFEALKFVDSAAFQLQQIAHNLEAHRLWGETAAAALTLLGVEATSVPLIRNEKDGICTYVAKITPASNWDQASWQNRLARYLADQHVPMEWAVHSGHYVIPSYASAFEGGHVATYRAVDGATQSAPSPKMFFIPLLAFEPKPSCYVEHEIFHASQIQLQQAQPLEAWPNHWIQLDPQIQPKNPATMLQAYIGDKLDGSLKRFAIEEVAAQLHTALAIRTQIAQGQNPLNKVDIDWEAQSRFHARTALHLAQSSLKLYRMLIEMFEVYPEDLRVPLPSGINIVSLGAPGIGSLRLDVDPKNEFYNVSLPELKRMVRWLSAYRDFIRKNPSLIR